MHDCIFCRIAKGDAPASVIYKDSDGMAFLDINPVQRGATVVIPKRHFVDIWEIKPRVLAKVFSLTKRTARRLHEVLDTEGITIFGQSGKPPGRHIYHFHVLVIPLGRGDRRKFTNWWLSAARRAKRSELDRLAEKLRFA